MFDDAFGEVCVRGSSDDVDFVAEGGQLSRDVMGVDALSAGVHTALMEEKTDPH
jgi:hypothetical protein